ncbi:MAG: glycosyltransferase family 2 protein [Bacteroidales bacterium]|nr:glycosyltransferase family 2 protein [Bacteroidales bacterium]
MLSILIPVYNFNIVSLVTELHKQALKASVSYEIIVLDDCSSELLRDQNKGVRKLKHVRFIELEKNIGRARIRNRLADMAQYSSLLFMDCDSEVPDDQYIDRYLPYVGHEAVVCGGRAYRSEQPEEPEYFLRWLYGLSHEQIPAHIRAKHPYRSFMTNNFMISKSILLQIQFDESIVKYGHEDTLFGLELKKRNIPIYHIQNPLIHIGVEPTGEFLIKMGESIENLVKLVKSGKIDRKYYDDIRILRYYAFLKKYGLAKIFLTLFDGFSNALYRNMSGSNPSLFLFSIYKLTLFCRAMHKKEQEA